jgi:hypothetical protein
VVNKGQLVVSLLKLRLLDRLGMVHQHRRLLAALMTSSFEREAEGGCRGS